jgi:hypothetical protein
MGPGKYPIDTMRKSERMRNAGTTASKLAAVTAFVLACLSVEPASPSAHELKEVSLQTSAGQTQLKLGFSPSGSEGDYPLYFQKLDPAKGTILLSFLETESAYPLGRHPLDASAPDLEEIVLKKITSPSGKNFLGVELKFRQPPTGDVPVQAAPKGVLKVMLGKGKGKFSWSLAKSLKEEDAYLSAKAVAPPPGAGKPPKLSPEAAAMEAAGRAAAGEAIGRPEPVTPAVPTEPGIPKTESPSAAAEAEPAAPASSLTELQVQVTAAQEDLILVFTPPGAPNHSPKRNAKDSTWLEVTLENAASGLKKREYTLPRNATFKRVKVNKLGSRLQLRIQLAPGADVQIKPQDGGLALSGLGKGDASSAFKWTTAKPEGVARESAGGAASVATSAATGPAAGAGVSAAADPADPVKSAHQEGQVLESGRGGNGKGLSSSRIFSVGMGSKTMVLLKDSASLKDAPGAKGKLIRKIPVGEKIEKVGNQGASLRVVSGPDTGFIQAADAVFADEVTPAQEKAIQGRIEAKAAKLAAAEARIAAAAAKEEARQAAAAAKEAEKARKADELAKKKADAVAAAKAKADSMAQAKADAAAAKAQAKADAAAAKAAAQAAAQQPPAGIQESQSASRPLDSKVSGKDPASQPSANNPGQASAGGPKLAIADNPELADKLAREKLAAEDEKKRVEPEENRIAYNSYGRRDPFIPVEQGASDNGIDIDQMKVVGIIWESQQPMAVLEHNREAGVSFTVKEGDPVHNGRVARISREAVTFDISEYGISRSYSLKLVSSKEGAKK